MKVIILISLIASWQLLAGQNFILDNFPTTEGKIIYTGVVHVDTTLKSTDLYLNAKNWLVEGFKSSKSVIQIDDKDLSIVVVKSYLSLGNSTSYYTSYDGKLWFTLKIEMKDHRYRYTLTDIRYEATASSSSEGIGPITAHVDEELETWFKNLELPAAPKKRTLYINQYNISCQKWNTDFNALLSSLEEGMKAKSTKDW